MMFGYQIKIISLLACSLVENTFWSNVIESWTEYVQKTVEASDLLSQPLWNNVFIAIENESLCFIRRGT